MSDIALNWGGFAADFGIEKNDLQSDPGLETAVLLSLFTNRGLDPSDPLPAGVTDRQGWWADAIPWSPGDKFGSRLWTLQREKQEPAVLVKAKEIVLEALQWMVDDQVAARVDVVPLIVERGVLGIPVTIFRPALAPLALRRYDYVWAAQLLRRP